MGGRGEKEREEVGSELHSGGAQVSDNEGGGRKDRGIWCPGGEERDVQERVVQRVEYSRETKWRGLKTSHSICQDGRCWEPWLIAVLEIRLSSKWWQPHNK